MRALLVLLFSVVACVAQLPVIPFVTQPNTAVNIPALQGTIALRWKETDLSGSQAVTKIVTNWVDEIVGKQMSMDNTAAQPTNAALGVHFNGSQWLTNSSGYSLTFSNPIVVIYQSQSGGSFGQLIGDNSGSANGWRLEGSQNQWWWEVGGGAETSVGGLSTSKYQDLIFCGCSNNSTDAKIFYTNGVLSRSYTGAPTPPGFLFKSIGAENTPAGDPFLGYIAEVIVYTNIPANGIGLSATAVSNLHYYRTNFWGGSP